MYKVETHMQKYESRKRENRGSRAPNREGSPKGSTEGAERE